MESMAYTIAEFCQTHKISRSHLYQAWAAGKGPDVMRIGQRALISTEAAAAWRASIAGKFDASTPVGLRPWVTKPIAKVAAVPPAPVAPVAPVAAKRGRGRPPRKVLEVVEQVPA